MNNHPAKVPVDFQHQDLTELMSEMESLQTGLWEWHIDADYAVINHYYAEMLGYQHEELNPISLSWLKEAVHPADRELLQQRLMEALTEDYGLLNLTFRLRHKAGHYVWVKSRGTVTARRDGKPARMLGFHLDIDSLLEDLGLKQLQSARADELVRNSPAVLYSLRLSSQQGAFETTFMSQNTREVVGIDRVHFQSDSDWLKLVHPEDTSGILAKFHEWLESDTSNVLVLRYRMKADDGSWQWLEDTSRKVKDGAGQLLEVVGSFVNITRETEQNDLLEKVAEVIPGVIYQYELKPDGSSCFPYASRKIRDIYGQSSEQVMTDASQVFDVIHPDDLPHVQQSIEQSAHDGGYWRCEYRVVNEGKVSWLRGEARAQEQNGSILWHGLIMDISAEKQVEKELEQAHSRLSRAQKLGRIGHWEVNLKTGELFWSDVIFDIFGFNKDDTVPSLDLFNSCIHPDDVTAVRASEERARQTGIHDVEHRIIRPDGTIRWVHELANFSALETGEGILHGNVRDITETKELEQRLAELANRDALTGLYSRRYLMQAGHQAIARCQREKQPVSLVMLDMDHFKNLNDSHGHIKGDEALRKVGKLLLSRTRASDIPARIGGEELVIVLPGVPEEDARLLALDLADKVRQLTVLDADQQRLKLTASFGVVSLSNHVENLDKLLVAADRAMYRAKKGGRDQVVVATDREHG